MKAESSEEIDKCVPDKGGTIDNYSFTEDKTLYTETSKLKV